jgi:hypothetical protein
MVRGRAVQLILLMILRAVVGTARTSGVLNFGTSIVILGPSNAEKELPKDPNQTTPTDHHGKNLSRTLDGMHTLNMIPSDDELRRQDEEDQRER